MAHYASSSPSNHNPGSAHLLQSRGGQGGMGEGGLAPRAHTDFSACARSRLIRRSFILHGKLHTGPAPAAQLGEHSMPCLTRSDLITACPHELG